MLLVLQVLQVLPALQVHLVLPVPLVNPDPPVLPVPLVNRDHLELLDRQVPLVNPDPLGHQAVAVLMVTDIIPNLLIQSYWVLIVV